MSHLTRNGQVLPVKKLGLEVVRLEALPIDFDNGTRMIMPAPKIEFTRTIGGKARGGKKRSEGVSVWKREANAVRQHRLEKIAKRDLVEATLEALEPETIPEPGYYPFFEDEVYDFDLSDTSIDYGYGDPDDIFFDDELEIDPEIVEMMDGHSIDPNEVCRSIDAWRHSPDLGDNFDDEPEFTGYWS